MQNRRLGDRSDPARRPFARDSGDQLSDDTSAEQTGAGAADRLFETRRAKLAQIEANHGTAFPARPPRSHTAADAVANVDLEPPLEVDVAGRLVGMRRMGGTSFAQIRDGTGEVQLYLNRQALGADAYRSALKLLDIGDFVSAGGPLFRTRSGEPSVRAERLQVAAKALRPLSAKWHGLKDHEIRFRQRYLDILANEDVRRRFEDRTAIVSALRRVLDAHGFLEVETPTLQPVYGGGAAVPFVTSYAALNRDYYLRIADELYLKRLLVAGFERVYEICKNFRNEGIDSSHSPEFTMLECYQAFADLSDMRGLVQELVAAAAQAVCGSTRVQFEDDVLDFTPPWRRLTYRDALLAATGVDLEQDGRESTLRAAAVANEIRVDPSWSRAKLLDELMKTLVEPTLVQPTLLERYPTETAPLAKRCPDDPRYIERFEVFVNGMEMANAYTELNDPLEQRVRMEEQASERHGEDATPVDADFLLALEHGMPPAGGLGIGVDRLVMALTGVTNIREVILFPQLRDRS